MRERRRKHDDVHFPLQGKGKRAMNLKALANIHETIAASDPALRRGLVWCRACGRTEKVNSAECLRHGWPKCCGATMSLGSPDDERK